MAHDSHRLRTQRKTRARFHRSPVTGASNDTHTQFESKPDRRSSVLGVATMGFLKRFLKTTFRDGDMPRGASSFENLTEEELEAHMNVARYGSFLLTDAVRPSYNLDVVPSAGYRHDVYQDKESGTKIPVLMASASRECLFDLFMDLVDPVGEQADVVLETSHERDTGNHVDLYREHIDMPVMKSTLYDFEDLLLDDGCCGIAVLNPKKPVEVQLDEHKLIIIYGHDTTEFEDILIEHGIPCSEDMRFITEAEHVHSSSEEYVDRFDQMRYRLGIDD